MAGMRQDFLFAMDTDNSQLVGPPIPCEILTQGSVLGCLDVMLVRIDRTASQREASYLVPAKSGK